MSGLSAPDEYITSNDGQSSPTKEFSSNESGGSGGVEPGSEPDFSTQVGSTAEQQTNEMSEDESTDEDGEKLKAKGRLNKRYRALLDSVIEDVYGTVLRPSEPVVSPDESTSAWTTVEEEAFFSALEKAGPDDLRTISTAIGSKSQLEVRAYLLALQQRDINRRPDRPRKTDYSIADVAAACEIGPDCEERLDKAAKILARHVDVEAINAERERSGEFWMIDEEAAATIERRLRRGQVLDRSESEHPSNGIPSPLKVEEARPDDAARNHPGEADAWNNNDMEHRDMIDSVPASALLLRPAAFLELSHCIFMNGAPKSESHWQDIGPFDYASPTPAMFHSALDDFYKLTVSLTRRVVQASIFQASSRLRAKDERNPKADVTADDVRTACSLLDLKPDWKSYWASVAQRCGLEVFNHAEKFQDGRSVTRMGAKLRGKEIEAELGLKREPFSPALLTTMKMESEEPTLGDAPLRLRSTIPESSFSDSSDGTEPDADDQQNSERRVEDDPAAPSDSDGDSEDEYLEYIDQQASQAEETRLYELLRIKQSIQEPILENAPRDPPLRKRAAADARNDWRKRTRHEAEWERFPSLSNSKKRAEEPEKA